MFSKLMQALVLVCVMVTLTECASSSSFVRAKRSALTEEADKILAQHTDLNINDVGQLIDLVERNGPRDCLARVICELVANNNAHGEPGVKFGRALLKFRQSKLTKAQFYLEAMTAGAHARHKPCKNIYKTCQYSSVEIIEVGNKVLKIA